MHKEDQKKRVGIWIRVSTEDQARGESPEHHEQRARYYAEAKGWQVIEVYHLEGLSGKSVMDQPETKRMLADVRRGHIDGLIFSKLARLARNTKELLEFSDIFREYNADLISLGESIDTSTPAGRLFYTIIAAMAQWEREEISARVAASVPIRAKLGKQTGGSAPFGYQWKDKKLIPNPEEAPIRKLLFDLFKEHKRKKTVARLLNESGYRTRSGAKFSDSTVHRLLEDPLAKGLRRANYTQSLGNKKHWKLKPKEDWVFTDVEPIVPEELWDECNRILNTMSNGKKPTRKAIQLFAGFTYCECGGKMYVPSNSPKYTCVKCRNKIPVEDLESVFHEQLKGFFFSSDDLAMFLSQADQAIHEKEELLKGLEKEHRQLETDIDTLFSLHQKGQIPTEGFGKRYQPLFDHQKQIEAQFPALQGEIDFLKIQHLSSDEIIREARDFYTRWPDLDQPEKRQVIETITEKITIGSDEVTIDLCYLPTSSELMASGQRNNIVALPFYHFRLKGQRPQPLAYPKELTTFGDWIRKTRLDTRLFQEQVAQILGVTEQSISNWELGHSEPEARYIPRIIEFIGYCPYDPVGDLIERMRTIRRALGLTQEQMSKILGVDESSLASWERREHKLVKRSQEIIRAFLRSPHQFAAHFPSQ